MELNAYQILEQLSAVVAYEAEPFWIEYRATKDSKIHRYIPDILVTYKDGTKELIEVKPANQVEENEDKFQAARAYAAENGMTFTVWTDQELKTA